LNPQADRDLAAIALQCLQKAPEARYESAAALGHDLDCWLRGEPTKARPPGLAGQAWRWLKRNAVAAAGIIALGTAGGLLVILAMVAAAGSDDTLYPTDIGPFNPLRWIELAQHVSVVRIGVLASAAILGLGIGWFVRLVTRPRTTRAALGAAAATGLVASLTAFSMLGPFFGSIAYGFQTLRVHPIGSDHPQFATEHLSAAEEEYLARYLQAELRLAGAPGRELALMHLRDRAVRTNQFCAAVIAGWSVLAVVLVFFLGLSLESTWAADYLSRSGRGPVARVVCYLELYPLAAVLLPWFLLLLVKKTATMSAVDMLPTWSQLVIPLALGAAGITLAHAGVIRGWRPAIRIIAYFVIIGLGLAWKSSVGPIPFLPF
jgi:hypothetical protein